MRFEHKKFFDGMRPFLARHDKRLTPGRVEGLDFLLTNFENDIHWSTIPQVAYAFATTCIEDDWTFQPIQEYGSYSYFERRYGSQTRKGRELGNDAAGEGSKYSGKGYVQLTGESNYEKLEKKLRDQYADLIAEYDAEHEIDFDLTDHAEQAKDPQLAFAIMTIGMHQGVYTGRKLSDYITSTKSDYVNARRVINGTDRAAEIAGYARDFERILKDSLISAAAPADEPTVTTGNVPVQPADSPQQQPQGSETPPTESTEHIEQTIEETDEGKTTETVIDKVDRAGDKLQSLQGTLDKWGVSIDDAKRSLGTNLLVGLKSLSAPAMVALGVITNHWELFVIAALLMILAYLLWERSGKRVADAKAGVPADVLKEAMK